MKHIKLFEEHGSVSPLIAEIQKALEEMKIDGQRHQNDVSVDTNSVSVSFRDLGNWEHDEESHGGDDEDGDDSWREDDDAMVWAPGEYKRYMAKFEDWAKSKPWYDKVKLNISTSEKNWVEFTVTIKK